MYTRFLGNSTYPHQNLQSCHTDFEAVQDTLNPGEDDVGLARLELVDDVVVCHHLMMEWGHFQLHGAVASGGYKSGFLEPHK